MRCTLKNREILIEGYLEHTLSEEEEQRFAEHYFECDACFEALQLQLETAALVREEGETLFASSKLKTVRPQPFWQQQPVWGLAAVFVMLIAALVIPKLFEPEPDFTNAGPAFQEFAPLENFIADPTMRGPGWIKSAEPDNDFIAEEQIAFVWEMDEAVDLIFRIVDNKSETVKMSSVRGDAYLIERVAEILKPGLYYWKLETRNGLLYVGRFFVPPVR